MAQMAAMSMSDAQRNSLMAAGQQVAAIYNAALQQQQGTRQMHDPAGMYMPQRGSVMQGRGRAGGGRYVDLSKGTHFAHASLQFPSGSLTCCLLLKSSFPSLLPVFFPYHLPSPVPCPMVPWHSILASIILLGLSLLSFLAWYHFPPSPYSAINMGISCLS